ncbi:pertactin-like passenger domain-containing protein, partial [Escherichia sp. SS-MK2]
NLRAILCQTPAMVAIIQQGIFIRTDMANHQSDQLNVTGQATGDFKIFVTDTGASPAAGDSLTLVTTGGGDAAFTLGNAGGVVDIGTY